MTFQHALTFAIKVILCFCEKNQMKIVGIIPKIHQKSEKTQFFCESLLVENQRLRL